MSASTTSPLDLIDRASRRTPAEILKGGIGGIFLAWFYNGIRIIDAFTNIFVIPLNAMITNVAGFLEAFIGGAGAIMRQGAATVVFSIAPGATWAIGPATFALAAVSVGLALIVMGEILQRAPTSDLIPFTFTDFGSVFPGFDLGADEKPEDVKN